MMSDKGIGFFLFAPLLITTDASSSKDLADSVHDMQFLNP